MRSIEYLAQLFPDKTGKELFEIQKQDKADDENEYNLRNEEKLKLINDINTNGGYYRGRFGLDQHFFYSFTDLKLESNEEIYCNVGRITAFLKEDISIDIKIEHYRKLDNYGIDIYERVTKEEYEKAKEYLQNFKSFWEK